MMLKLKQDESSLDEDDVLECITCERIAEVERNITDAVAADMHCRRREGIRIVDFVVERLVACALERSRTARKVSMEDADDDVEDELETTALRVAHDILLPVEKEERRESAADNAYFVARSYAEKYAIGAAEARLAVPLVAKFRPGVDMEAQLVREALCQARRQRYRQAYNGVREKR